MSKLRSISPELQEAVNRLRYKSKDRHAPVKYSSQEVKSAKSVLHTILKNSKPAPVTKAMSKWVEVA